MGRHSASNMAHLCPCHIRDLLSPPVLDSPSSDHQAPRTILCRLCSVIRTGPQTLSLGTSGGVLVFLRQIFLLYTVLYAVCIPSAMAVKVHEIKWKRYFWGSPVNGTILRVREDDKIKFICPSSDGQLALFWTKRRKNYDNCTGDNSLFACNTSSTFDVQVTEFQWLPGLPSFNKGQPVYFVGRQYQCLNLGMRFSVIYTDQPEQPVVPKKTTTSIDWSHTKTTAYRPQPTRGHTKAEYLTYPHRPKTSTKAQKYGRPSTTKIPQSAVPMPKTSRAGFASYARSQGEHRLTVLVVALLSLIHRLAAFR